MSIDLIRLSEDDSDMLGDIQALKDAVRQLQRLVVPVRTGTLGARLVDIVDPYEDLPDPGVGE